MANHIDLFSSEESGDFKDLAKGCLKTILLYPVWLLICIGITFAINYLCDFGVKKYFEYRYGIVETSEVDTIPKTSNIPFDYIYVTDDGDVIDDSDVMSTPDGDFDRTGNEVHGILVEPECENDLFTDDEDEADDYQYNHY